MWKRIKKLLGRKPEDADAEAEVYAEAPSQRSYEVHRDTPWGVPVLDVQSLTQHVVSTTRIREFAENSVSYQGDEGPQLATQRLDVDRTTEIELRFALDGPVFDGTIQLPSEMEEKWAIYFQDRELLFVRSWTKRVLVRASVDLTDDQAIVRVARGAFVDENESPDYTRALLEYLLRDYGFREGLAMPIPFDFAGAEDNAAMFAFSTVGRTARFVTHHPMQLPPPQRPFRTVNALHRACARGDIEKVDAALSAGLPFDVRATDGLAALHWATLRSPDFVTALLDRGADIDVRTEEGATPLMQAAQGRSEPLVRLLLERGADALAQDHRGFTTLHRAAEIGELAIAELLLDAGASPTALAGEHSPLSLATKAEETAMVELLSSSAAR